MAATDDSTSTVSNQTRRSRAAAPFRAFVATPNANAIVLLGATLVALLWANSPWSDTYEELWHTDLAVKLGDSELEMSLRHWVNDGLMTFFFFVVGLEIRREFDMGELRERRRLATPVVAAIGGMVVPALIYVAFTGGTPDAKGWGIVVGTDTAFALGVLALVGKGFSPRMRVFLLTLVIVDDIVALLIIAFVYTGEISPPWLLATFALFGVAVVLRAAGIRNGVVYFVVGLVLWWATFESGVHATISGIALGLLATAAPPSRDGLDTAAARWRSFREQPTPELARSTETSVRRSLSPNERLQHLFDPWTALLIVPLFALANAGITLDGTVLARALRSPITLGIVAGLVLGKVFGITIATWLGSRRWLGRFPLTVEWPPMIGVATVAGIGFTVALLIADLAFEGEALEEAKVGILAASILATALSWLVFTTVRRLPDREGATGTRIAPPIIDLARDVDPEVDHIRGATGEAKVTLVEYSDFECPFCGRAEPIVRELLDRYGSELCYVFRHLPLGDVHVHAELAAEAAEAAAAHGRFWEMHDRMFEAQDHLELDDLVGYAVELGIDPQGFRDSLMARKHALRVERDVESAAESGVAGTPTFFVNGHRHHGAFDIDALSAMIEREAHAPEPRAGTAGR
jgi:Na+/H+ antiporter NhaA